MKKPALLLALLFSVQFSFGQTSEEVITAGKEFRVAFQGGVAYRLARISGDTPSILKSYAENLKSGYSVGVDAAYFLKPSWGLGIKYNRFGSRAAVTNMAITYDNGSSAYGSISDNISINFFGPSYVSKYTLANPRHIFFGGMSLGYLGYHDDAVLVNRSFQITGATLGAAFDAGYDYKVSKYITLGAQASVVGGTLSRITMQEGTVKTSMDLDEQNRENLSRLDISAGVRFKI